MNWHLPVFESLKRKKNKNSDSVSTIFLVRVLAFILVEDVSILVVELVFLGFDKQMVVLNTQKCHY